MKTTLRTVPFTIDADEIAEGMLAMFTDEERTILRFGMLPAAKMECTQKCLRDKFLEQCRTSTSEDDMYTAWCKRQDGGLDFIEFKMSKLVNEAMHLISLAIYKIGDLVV